MKPGRLPRIPFLAMAVLFLCPCSHGSGQQTNQTAGEQAVPASAMASQTNSSSATSWILGIARFTEEGMESAISRSVYGAIVPRLILEALPVLPTRAPSGTTVLPVSDIARKETMLYAAGKGLAKALDDKARIELDPDLDKNRQAAEIRTVEQQITASRTRIQELKGETPVARLRAVLGLTSPIAAAVAMPTGPGPIPVVWWKGAASDIFPESDQDGPSRIAVAENLDGLVFGSVRREGSDLVLTVKGYEKKNGNIVLLYTGRTPIQKPKDLIPEIAEAIEVWVAARPLAKFDLSVNPRDAIVSVDGIDLEGAVRRLFYYTPATLKVSARSDGFVTWKGTVDILPGSNRTVAVELLPLAPSGKIPKENSVIDPGVLKILDRGREAGYTQAFNTRKDRFYSALGFLVGSIPATIIAGGNFSLFAEATTRTSDSRIATGYTVSAAVLGAGIAATAFFTVNTIIRLVDYLGAAH